MGVNALYPGYIQINYTTTKAAHSMRLPTREWNGGVGANGGYTAWDGNPVTVEDMVEDFVDAVKASCPAGHTFVDYTAYTIAAPTGESAVPVYQAALGVAGTAVGVGVDAAVATFSFKTTAFGDSRVVLADITPNTNFKPRAPLSFNVNDLAIAAEFGSTARAWSGRDGTRPAVLRRVVFDLNDGLRRAYKYV